MKESAVQILTTKLTIPPQRTNSVARPRLLLKLDQVSEVGFALISAPAGYGKSTLISAWLRRTQAHGAWMTLDDDDNDSFRFWGHLIAALGTVESDLRDLAEFSGPSELPADAGTLLTPLINRLERIHRPICLVLDDYHAIQNQQVHQWVGFLLEHRPRLLRLVIVTRADPPLPLARLRARSEMVEVRQVDLSFTDLEATDFLNRTMGLRISTQDVARLTARTEGWIAGLQMAALSMKNAQEPSAFIDRFTGSHHYIYDYMLEEILDRQSPEIRRFLLSTAVLETLSAPLCDELLAGEKDFNPHSPSSVLLEALEHANLFITPLDPQQQEYRFHPLFSELLRGYLQKNDPERLVMGHQRASAWYESHGQTSDAIRHALAANDWERTLRLVSANVFALLEQNELNSVKRQLDSSDLAFPGLWVARAWLAAYTGQLSAVEPILGQAEAEIHGSTDPEEQRNLRGHAAAIRAYSAWIAGKNALAVRAAREALASLSADEWLFRCQSATVLGLADNDMGARAEAFDQALEYSRQVGISHVTFFAHGCRAYMLVLQGRLHEAHAVCQEALRLAQTSGPHPQFPTLCYIYATLGMVLFEWNDLEGALRCDREAVRLAQRWEQADALHFAYTNLAEALFASGDEEGAFQTLQTAWLLAQRTSAWFQELSIGQEVELRLAQGRLNAALQRLRTAQVNLDASQEDRVSIYLLLVSIPVFLAQKNYERALAMVSTIFDTLEKKKINMFLVRVLLWQALAYQGLGQGRQALASLGRALSISVPEGYIRSYLAAGRALIPVLRQAREAGLEPAAIDNLLVAFQAGEKTSLTHQKPVSSLVEPLTERELEVLRLLAQGNSDQKIADKLVIARETVHKHLKNIYGKLDVHSRTEAVACARELNLL